ncbi:MAG TPA: group III truncated hemoglobin [Pedobacter sp.]
MDTKQDIKCIEEIRWFVDQFYDRIHGDELLSPIFNFRLSGYWQPHLEKMYGFWNAALFGVKGYAGNPFMKHMTMELKDEHFQRWLDLFNEVIDSHFSGPVAADAKNRALIMANMFRSRLAAMQTDNRKPVF